MKPVKLEDIHTILAMKNVLNGHTVCTAHREESFAKDVMKTSF